MVTKPKSRSAREPRDTRLALIRAAERLFAERGVDAVSLREVSKAAGLRNNSAVLYYFESRERLIDAILERHSVPIQLRYEAQLDLIEQGVAQPVLRQMFDMIVRPLVARLDDADGGFAFISISAQLTVNPRFPLNLRPVSSSATVMRLVSVMLPLVQIPPELLPLRMERISALIYSSIIGWHRMTSGGDNGISREVFTSDLVDTVMAVVCVDPSRVTTSLLPQESAQQ